MSFLSTTGCIPRSRFLNMTASSGHDSRLRVQEYLSKLASARFDNIDLAEMRPFIAAMQLIKVEYGSGKPEVYKMLVSLLQDYNPYLGHTHYQKTVKYIKILLEEQPNLAEYLISIIPKLEDVQQQGRVPAESSTQDEGKWPKHSLHTLSNVSGNTIHSSSSCGGQTDEDHLSETLECNEICSRKPHLKYEKIRQQLDTPSIGDQVFEIKTLTSRDRKSETSKNRPIILRKANLQELVSKQRLPPAKITNKRNSSGNQTFPYTQQVVFSDGRKQNFIFASKNREEAAKRRASQAQGGGPDSSRVTVSSKQVTTQNPLARLQEIVSAAADWSPPTDLVKGANDTLLSDVQATTTAAKDSEPVDLSIH